MKLIKLVFVCLIVLFKADLLLGQVEDINTPNFDCNTLPELINVEISNNTFVEYTWLYEDSLASHFLEYKGRDGCITTDIDVGEPVGEISCPPDVWTVVPVPTLKTLSPSSQNLKGFAVGTFLPCNYFEFRLKVACNNDTIYSNVVPFFNDQDFCPDCVNTRIITENHEIDTTIQVEDQIVSTVKVLANVTYKAGERIELLSGFSVKTGCNFSIFMESCSEL